jgi:hypothetical protein
LAGVAFVMAGLSFYNRRRNAASREQPTVVIAAATLAAFATTAVTYRPTNLASVRANDPMPLSPYLLPVEDDVELGDIPMVTAVAYFEGTDEDRLAPY